MAIYTTLFTATDSELTELFPGWRLPLPAPAPRQETRKNPFAGQAEDITIVTWDPGSPVPRGELPSLYEGIDRPLLPPVLPPDGEFLDYQQWLEDCCPTVLRTLPHVAMKGITHYELQELGAVLVGDNVPPGRFVDCPEDEGFIGAIQAQAIPLLAKASRKQLQRYSAKWCARLEEGEGDALVWVLLRLRALARDAVTRQANLFSHTRV